MRFPLTIGIILLLLLTSCRSETDRRLDDIGRFARSNPDSALTELGKGFDSTRMSRTQLARHKLLTAQSMDAAWMDSLLAARSDSLLAFPIRHFRETGDDGRLAVALLLKGNCEYNDARYPEALRVLLEAAELADRDTIHYWSMRAHELLHYIYKNGYQADKSVEHLRKAALYSRLANRPMNELYNRSDMAVSYLDDRRYDAAVALADSILREYSWMRGDAPDVWGEINYYLIQVYAETKNNDKALKAFHYVSKAAHPRQPLYYLAVNQMFVNLEEYDKAAVYLDSARITATTREDSMIYSRHLAERLRREEREEEAIPLELAVKKWSDSVATTTLSRSLTQVEADFNRDRWLRQQESSRRLKILGWTAAIAILIAGGATLIFIRRRRRMQQERLLAMMDELRNTFETLKTRDEELRVLINDEGRPKGQLGELLEDKVAFIRHVADCWSRYGGDDYDGKGIDLRHIVADLRAPESMRLFHDLAEKNRGRWPDLKEKDLLLQTLLGLGLSVKAIAMLLDEPVKTIYSRHSRLRAKTGIPL